MPKAPSTTAGKHNRSSIAEIGGPANSPCSQSSGAGSTLAKTELPKIVMGAMAEPMATGPALFPKGVFDRSAVLGRFLGWGRRA